MVYTHPYPLDAKEKYMVELALGAAVNQSLPKPVVEGDPNSVNLKDVRTLPVNNPQNERVLKLRVLTSKGIEVARSEINLQPFFVSPGSMIEIKTQKFDVVLPPVAGQPLDDTKKGLLNIKIKFVPAPAQPAEDQQEEVKQPIAQ